MFIVVREIEADRLDDAVFTDENDARAYYRDAARICDNGPGDGPGDDPTIVSNCWLYSVAAPDACLARAMVRDGRAKLMKSYA